MGRLVGVIVFLEGFSKGGKGERVTCNKGRANLTQALFNCTGMDGRAGEIKQSQVAVASP